MRDDWKPEVDDDPRGSDRGQRSAASLDEEMLEFDLELEEMAGYRWPHSCVECRSAKEWLTGA